MKICFLGHADRAEFQLPCQEMKVLLQQSGWTVSFCSNFPDVPIDSDLVVLFQSGPDEFSESDVVALKYHSPLTPVILLAGSASEGEARTGRIPYGVFRLYAHQWNHEYLAEFAYFLEGKPSIFALPATFEAEEVVLFQAERDKLVEQTPVSHKRTCCIVSCFGPFGNDSAMNAMLADFFRRQNDTVFVGLNKIDRDFAGLILADADDVPLSEVLQAAQRLRSDFAEAEMDIYINSPRIDEKKALMNVGVAVRAKNGTSFFYGLHQ